MNKLALVVCFAMALLGAGLLVYAWPGLLTGVAPIADTSAPVSALLVSATETWTPTSLPLMDSATPTPWSPTGTPTLMPTLPASTAVPSPTAVPLSPTPALQRALATAERLAAGQLTADESNLLAMLNDERTRAGLPALALDPVLQSIAHGRAVDMIVRGFYSHVDPATGQLAAKSMLLNLGVRYSTSENFYSGGPYNAAFAGRAMQWLMGDAIHRTNILLRFWNTVGVGLAGTPGGIAVVTQEFGAK